ncbi:hypothetical protein J2S43_004481 [Catenuloplanes nepalensis]|uniref:Lipoprotein n=1 Tax=Catenuloplanes nepalensis TaxID=587533 RepID=A0ABT9MX03_9ACTN|nr:hypothetical protein [Catenuloplanes nepalensis]MDP9795969.1 hypothetical protein [Catenuloplanes nepalensis]
MIKPDRPRRLLAALAAALCLTACGAGGDDGGDGWGSEATPTAWPQPVDGKLTDAMCDVLTVDDFLAVGVEALRWEDRGPAPDIGPNAISCHALGSHFFSLNLQPDPVSGELYFGSMRDQRARTSPAAIGTTAVPGADEAWFNSTTADDSEIIVRRGALLISMSIGFAHADEGFDPQKASTTLAGQVLERLPGVGRTATGKPHEMVLTVTGKDTRTATISYNDPITAEPVQESVGLPWTKRIQFPSFGRPTSISLSASVTAVSLTTVPTVTCGITIDGEEEPKNNGPGPGTFCYHSFAEPR